MDLDQGRLRGGRWTRCSRNFEIIAKERKKTTQNLEELENEDIKDSLDHAGCLPLRKKAMASRTALAEYRITSRGGKGVTNMKEPPTATAMWLSNATGDGRNRT